MKVIYSVQVPLGKGFGFTAEKQVEAIDENNSLFKLITPNIIKNFSDDFDFDFQAAQLVGIDKADVFIGWGNACLEQLKEAKKLGMKTIVNRASTYIDYQDKILGKEGMKLDPESVRRQIEEYELANHILVPCDFVKDTFPEALKHKVKVIPFGVDSDKFTGDYSIKSKKFTVLYCGQNVRRKGLKYLMQAWLDLNLENAELRIIGDNPFNIEFTNVIFTGYVKDIVKEYQQASVFCLPSLEEGMALVVAETASCGLPFIISTHTGYNDIFKNGEEGFIIPPKNTEILKDKIRYLYENPDEIKRMGNNANKTIQKYPWSKFQSEFVKFIKSL